MPSGLAWLSGLSAGASTLGKGMDEKSILAEQRKRQQIQDALAELSKFDELGASVAGPDALDKLRLSQMDQMDPMAPLRGGPSLTSQRDQQRQHGDAKTITLPDGRTILIDPSQSRSARSADAAARALATREAGQDERQGKRLDADFNRQMALEKLRDQRQNETFNGSPLNLGEEPGTPAGVYLRGSRGTLQRVGAAPPQSGMSEYQERSLRLREDAEGRKTDGRPMSPAMIEKEISLDGVIGAVDRAAVALNNAVNAGKNATGRVFGVLPTPNWVKRTGITGQGSDEATTAQNYIGDLTSMVGNLRSGGAITPQEFERLEAFLPSPNNDEAKNALMLKNFRITLQQIKADRAANYEAYGIRAPVGRGTPPPPQDRTDKYRGA